VQVSQAVAYSDRPFYSWSTTLKNCLIAGITALLVTGLLGGCAQYENRRGVEVTWQDTVTDKLVRGQTTREEALRLLGPPSQVISMEEETVLYYLFERSKGEGVILIVFNRMKIDTDYDRAVLFFDENDILTDFATRIDESADA
jgi:outer membrane protein assembly factor BamE (lipoprotein component of BamABCDE complex)